MKTKYFFLLSMMFFMLTPRYFSRTQTIRIQIYNEKTLQCKEDVVVLKPPIIQRLAWDKNKALLKQYELNKKLGQTFCFKIFNKTRYRKIKEICYLINTQDSSILESIYSRIVIHHTAIDWTGDAIAQAKFICEGEILDKDYKFSDIAYHFFIASNGTILEGRPLSHMGTHAGKIVEKDITLDPDYGSIGIVLMGNFDKKNPSEKQKESLIKLLSWLKWEYLIPDNGISYHREVKGLVEATGLTSLSKDKTCPGRHFPPKEELLGKLIEDLDESCHKKTYFGR